MHTGERNNSLKVIDGSEYGHYGGLAHAPNFVLSSSNNN
jgi:hypothetical protein